MADIVDQFVKKVLMVIKYQTPITFPQLERFL